MMSKSSLPKHAFIDPQERLQSRFVAKTVHIRG
jgi:hypothetical protein